ncbi:MAG: hypothetical protein JWN35_1728 [Frankiales bacterium]|nr:hypothetical protein [Frankiales bacterium]
MLPAWEVGSESHWDATALRPSDADEAPWLPQPHSLYATGTAALVALIKERPGRTRLHLPSYFCLGVAAVLARYAELRWYRDLPGRPGPEAASLLPEPGDVVLAVNLFGRSSRAPWEVWLHEHPEASLVEDHTHDPQSVWARTSGATYCLASLRKTLPVPDGALLWSPAGQPLPVPASPANGASSLKLAAMVLKGAWLEGKAVAKPDFRRLQMLGEAGLMDVRGASSDFTRLVLPGLDVRGMRAVRASNVAALAERVGEDGVLGGYARLLPDAPVGSVPFQLPVICRSSQVRDHLLAHLLSNGVYAAVHWRQDGEELSPGDHEALDLSRRILTLPVDHRTSPPDVERISAVLAAFPRRSLP